jgi:hypothetical protein
MAKKEWEKHREEIEQLFIKEGWPLKDVIDHFRLKRDFHAS